MSHFCCKYTIIFSKVDTPHRMVFVPLLKIEIEIICCLTYIFVTLHNIREIKLLPLDSHKKQL